MEKPALLFPRMGLPDPLSQPRQTNTHRAQLVQNQLYRGPLRTFERTGDVAALTGTTGSGPATLLCRRLVLGFWVCRGLQLRVPICSIL